MTYLHDSYLVRAYLNHVSMKDINILLSLGLYPLCGSNHITKMVQFENVQYPFDLVIISMVMSGL